MKFLLLLIFFSLEQNFISSVLSEENGVARYDHYRLYKVELATEEQVKLFQDLEANSDSIVFYGHAHRTQQNLMIMVAAHKVADFEDILHTNNMRRRILTHNFQKKIDKNLLTVQPKSIDASDYDWQHFFHLETINNWLKLKVQQHPNLLTLIDLGASTEHEPTLGLKLAHNAKNKAIFLESGIHAREWIAPATATFIINELLTSNDTEIQRLAQTYNWHIFPVTNPDGYKYTFDRDRMWRKNRANFGICRGVDLNRNFPYHWNTTGTSGNPCHYDYAGPAAASEVETKNIMKYLVENLQKEQFETFLSLHSYSQLIMFPFAYGAERAQNYDDLTLIAKKAAQRINEVSGRVYKSGSIYETIYPSSGGSKDWALGELKIPITLTFELRGPPDGKDSFLLPAEEIEPTAQEAFAAIVTIIQEAEKLGYYK